MRVVNAVDTTVRGRTRRKTRSADQSGIAGSTAPTERTPFLDILDEILPVSQSDSEDLHSLWAGLPQAERDLLQVPSTENFNAYRDLVKHIAAATLRRNTRLRSMTRRGSKGQELKLQVVEFVDARLQKMAIMMHSSRNSAFALLSKFEEIRGFLLDLRQ